MSDPTLAEAISAAGGPVPLLRDAPAAAFTFPVAPEFSNWRSEQRAWRESCVLFDQSHHMTDLFLTGPGALELLAGLAVNDLTRFPVDTAKQFVAVNRDGFLIGDAILFRLGEESFDLVGHPTAPNWVQYHAERGDHDVIVERDENSAVRRDEPPALYRYELQGPAAGEIVRALTGAPAPQVRFFAMAHLTVDGLTVRALRHGMAGQPGFELFGPWDQAERVRDAILAAGAPSGLVPAGALAYSTSNLESGWVPTPLPAIFDGDATADYRDWLPAAGAGSLGGSFASDDIADYYLRPVDLGYGGHVSLEHDFVGRDALAALADRAPVRRKVTLVWNPKDVTRVLGGLVEPGDKPKFLDLPKARYALYQFDAVRAGGELAGRSLDCGYLANESAFVSLATLDAAHAEPGTEVTVVWGEDPVSAKPRVEPHVQTEIRATVAPAPFVDFARSGYRS